MSAVPSGAASAKGIQVYARIKPSKRSHTGVAVADDCAHLSLSVPKVGLFVV